jgi:hypothetical protein
VHAQPEQYWISTYYISLPLLALALIALRNGDRIVRILAVLTAFACLLALGEAGGLYTVLRNSVGLLSFMRFPIKLVVIAGFCLPLLGALAIAPLLHSSPKIWKFPRLVVAFLALLSLTVAVVASLAPHPLENSAVTWKNALFRICFLLVFALSFACLASMTDLRRQRFLGIFLLLVLWGDALNHAPWQNPTVGAWAFKGTAVELHPKPALGTGRAMISPPASDKLDHLQYDVPANDVLASRVSLYANANLLESVPKFDGFYALYLRDASAVLYELYSSTNSPSPLLDFLSISHLTAPGKTLEWTNRPTALPWVTIGQQSRPATPNDISYFILEPRFDPRSEVFLSAEFNPPQLPPVKNAKILKTELIAHRWLVEVETSQPTVVVLSQSWHPNWEAYVDRQPTPILKANFAFQAITIPAGSHTVELVYRDKKFNLALPFALLGIFITLGYWFKSRSQFPVPKSSSPL